MPCGGRRGGGEANWHNRFKGCGYRWTMPRRVIMDVLNKTSKHLSAEDIFLKVHGVYENIGLTTVYRTLEILVEMGMVTKCDFGDGRARYELSVSAEKKHHHHLVCTSCKRVIEYTEFIDEEVEFFKRMEKGLSKKYNFIIKDHTLQFCGICENCRNKS